MKRSFDTAKSARRRLLLSCVAGTAMCVLGREVHSQSPYDVECSKLPGTLRTRDEVSAAFACKGDRSALAMRALDVTEPEVAVQGMIQYLAASYLSLPMLAKANGMAQSAPTAVRRSLGLHLIANAIYPPLWLTPADTVTSGDLGPRDSVPR